MGLWGPPGPARKGSSSVLFSSLWDSLSETQKYILSKGNQLDPSLVQ